MEEERRTEVVYEINFGEEEVIGEHLDVPELEGVDLDDSRAIADYYLSKNNLIDPNEIQVEKKEKEIRKDIEKIIDDKESLIDYLSNLHASIEVIEERIYELELKDHKNEKENESKLIRKAVSPGSGQGISGRGLGSLPISLF
jgi:predicted nuclease with TOPRIM domain